MIFYPGNAEKRPSRAYYRKVNQDAIVQLTLSTKPSVSLSSTATRSSTATISTILSSTCGQAVDLPEFRPLFTLSNRNRTTHGSRLWGKARMPWTTENGVADGKNWPKTDRLLTGAKAEKRTVAATGRRMAVIDPLQTLDVEPV